MLVFKMSFFHDSYAIIGLIEGNQSYKPYQDFKIVTSVLNIGEVYAILLRNEGKNKADEWFANFNFDLLEILPEDIIKATYFRYINRKKKISITDAVGYTLSFRHKLKFLTGDKQFEHMPNIEFVK